MSFFLTDYDAGFDAVEIMGPNSEGIAYGSLLAVVVKPKTTALLGLATVTIRWNDGSPRSQVFACPLTTMSGLASGVIAVCQAPGEDVTAEATLVGSGAEFSFGFFPV